MKNYNFDLAKEIIKTLDDLGVLYSASLGMHEDWFWTGQEIWVNGKYENEYKSNEEAKVILKEYYKAREEGLSVINTEGMKKYQCVLVGGLSGSSWATPVIEVEMKDGSKQTFNCYYVEGKENETAETILNRIKKSVEWTGGCLSGPMQESREGEELLNFKEK